MLTLALFLCFLNFTLVLSDNGCFAQNPPGKRQVIGPTLTDCYQAIAYIPSGTDKSRAPIVFSHDSKAGYQVPKKWIYGDCGIDIDLKKDAETEVSTFNYIGNIALGLAEYCVKKTPPYLGGLSEIGENSRLQVILYGWRPQKNVTISQENEGLSPNTTDALVASQ